MSQLSTTQACSHKSAQAKQNSTVDLTGSDDDEGFMPAHNMRAETASDLAAGQQEFDQYTPVMLDNGIKANEPNVSQHPTLVTETWVASTTFTNPVPVETNASVARQPTINWHTPVNSNDEVMVINYYAAQNPAFNFSNIRKRSSTATATITSAESDASITSAESDASTTQQREVNSHGPQDVIVIDDDSNDNLTSTNIIDLTLETNSLSPPVTLATHQGNSTNKKKKNLHQGLVSNIQNQMNLEEEERLKSKIPGPPVITLKNVGPGEIQLLIHQIKMPRACAKIKFLQIFISYEMLGGKMPTKSSEYSWELIEEIPIMPLPMEVTFTMPQKNKTVNFIVRAKDIYNRNGIQSDMKTCVT